MRYEDETIHKKLQDMSSWERWIWLATEKVTADSIRDPYPTNQKVIKQIKSRLMMRGIRPSHQWPHK